MNKDSRFLASINIITLLLMTTLSGLIFFIGINSIYDPFIYIFIIDLIVTGLILLIELIQLFMKYFYPPRYSWFILLFIVYRIVVSIFILSYSVIILSLGRYNYNYMLNLSHGVIGFINIGLSIYIIYYIDNKYGDEPDNNNNNVENINNKVAA